MPVGLPDILSSDGTYMYMRSQVFDLAGKRTEMGPHSGDPAGQGSVQRGETAHLFAPTGFLDGTWFHRSYWVYGRSFAGGHSGYHQAGKFAPGARLMVFDENHVYGFGRKPQYYRWTTPLEHQLFAAPKVAPEVKRAPGRKTPPAGSMVSIANSASLDPTNTPFVVAASVASSQPNGTVIARGGPAVGYALYFQKGVPHFCVRTGNEHLFTVAAKSKVKGRWHHLAGALTTDKQVQLYVDGKLVASTKANSFIPKTPRRNSSSFLAKTHAKNRTIEFSL